MAKNIGFERETQKAKKNAEEEFEEFQKLEEVIKNEIGSTAHVEQKILTQLNSVKHLEHNLFLLEQKLRSLRTLETHRNSVLEALTEESNKRPSIVDTKKCEYLLNSIHQLDNDIYTQLEFVNEHLKKLRVEDTHHLYSEGEETRKALDEIDTKASKMISEAKKLGRTIHNDLSLIRTISELIKKIEGERKNNREKNPIGFR